MEGECYQKIGKIQEKLGDMDKAIEFLNKFLTLCQESQEKEAKKKAGEAHR